jgi:hypothetical protein
MPLGRVAQPVYVELRQVDSITCFFVFGARAAGICSMPHITALLGGDVGPAPSWRLFHKHRLLIAPPHLHILHQKPLKKDIDPLNFFNTLPETPCPTVNDVSRQHIPFVLW